MQVYNTIASHFSDTRYKVWSCVKRFLDQQPSSSSVIEAGCGNGKNLVYARQLGMSVYGYDSCQEFVDICLDKGLDVWRQDILESHDHQYDLVLSIAVLHHLSSHKERLEALENLYQLCRSGGRIMITVWSYERSDMKKERDFVLGGNLVPWNTKDGKIHDRYYYIYNHETFVDYIEEWKRIHPEVEVNIEWERQNWIAVLHKPESS